MKISQNVNVILSTILEHDPKTFIQELYQDMKFPPPQYKVKRVEGTPDHQPEFLCEHNGQILGNFLAKNKSKNLAIRDVAEKMAKLSRTHPRTKAIAQKIIKNKLALSFRNKNYHPVSIYPKKLEKIVLQTQTHFEIPIRKSLLFQALTTKRQANIATPHNDTLSLFGALIIQYHLRKNMERLASICSK